MIISSGVIKVIFLREWVTDAFKLPIRRERFYSIPVIFIEIKYPPYIVSEYIL